MKTYIKQKFIATFECLKEGNFFDTQKQFAQTLKISPQFLSQILRDNTPVPQDLLMRLFQTYPINLGFFYRDEKNILIEGTALPTTPFERPIAVQELNMHQMPQINNQTSYKQANQEPVFQEQVVQQTYTQPNYQTNGQYSAPQNINQTEQHNQNNQQKSSNNSSPPNQQANQQVNQQGIYRPVPVNPLQMRQAPVNNPPANPTQPIYQQKPQQPQSNPVQQEQGQTPQTVGNPYFEQPNNNQTNGTGNIRNNNIRNNNIRNNMTTGNMPINDLPIKDLPTNNNQVFNGEAQTNQANGSPVSYPSLDLEIAKALENAAKAQLELAQLIEKMRNLYHSK